MSDPDAELRTAKVLIRNLIVVALASTRPDRYEVIAAAKRFLGE